MNPAVSQVISRNLLFVGGKGGVGKTVVSQAIARCHANQGQRTLWVTIEDPTRPYGGIHPLSPNLWFLNCDPTAAFEEYAALKIGMPTLTRIFLRNKLMRYLAQAAPGIHELVLLGKIWYERTHYDHVVVDMPSTGYGIAMFQSTSNFARLFGGGPIQRDAEEMLATFKDPKITGHLIVALPEEMPLVESLELGEHLHSLFPENKPGFLVNRKFPQMSPDPSQNREQALTLPHAWENPLASSALDYAFKRNILETHNLRIWDEQNIVYDQLSWVPPAIDFKNEDEVIHSLVRQMGEKRIA
ncbi:ArsA-related P-loop ATPase [Bdellovibrionota bacterium FG-1]